MTFGTAGTVAGAAGAAGGVGASCADAPKLNIMSAPAAADTPIPQVSFLFTAVISIG